MAKMQTLHDLFIEQLKDMRSAEKQLVDALPKMARSATDPELKRAFEEHLNVTQAQLDRVEQVLQMMGENQGRKKCKGMEGLLMEGEEIMTEESIAPAVKDAGLIAAAQKVEHYEIASYGTLRTYANLMGHREAGQVLQQILDEEGRADKMLTQIAERGPNIKADDMGMGQGQGQDKSGSGRSGSGGSNARGESSGSGSRSESGSGSRSESGSGGRGESSGSGSRSDSGSGNRSGSGSSGSRSGSGGSGNRG